MANSESRNHRKTRIRKKVSGTATRPRLSIYKSLRFMYAQVIDDQTGRTLAAASSLSKELGAQADEDKKNNAKRVGALIAQKCKAANISAVVFDRNGFPYHGRVAAVAEGAREAGLQF